jgi:ketosteroid isomerase-like protein
MSHSNVETARRAFQAYLRQDMAGMLADVHPGLITTRPGVDLETFHGPDGLLRVIAEWTESFREFDPSDEEYIDANENQVIVRVRQSAVGAESGAPVVGQFWFLCTFEDGKIVRLDMYPQEASAFEAASLRPRTDANTERQPR